MDDRTTNDIPMLHSMSHIRGLNDMLNHNRRLAVHFIFSPFAVLRLVGKRLLPSRVAQIFEIFVPVRVQPEKLRKLCVAASTRSQKDPKLT